MVTFLKLGGSLITDKTRPAWPQLDVLQRLAQEVSAALGQRPEMQLLIGHGSGSFGHFAAKPYNTREGVSGRAQWRGYAEVSAAAARLNRLVTDTFLSAGVPVLSLQPSASARCRDGVLQYLDLAPVQSALEAGLVPLVYGDVALDTVRSGTIISTEEILSFLAHPLQPERIILLGAVAGVLDAAGQVIPHIRPRQFEEIAAQLGGSHGVDVTGGMLSKVASMVDLVIENPQLSVQIFSGIPVGALQAALVDPAWSPGTRLSAG